MRILRACDRECRGQAAALPVRKPGSPSRAVGGIFHRWIIDCHRGRYRSSYLEFRHGKSGSILHTLALALDRDLLLRAGQTVGGRLSSDGEVWGCVGGQWILPHGSAATANRLRLPTVVTLDFSPDGQVLAVGGGQPSRAGEIVLLRASDGSLLRRFDDLHSDAVLSLRFSPDGASCSGRSARENLRSREGKRPHTSKATVGTSWALRGNVTAAGWPSASADNAVTCILDGAAIASTAFDKEITSLCFLGSSAWWSPLAAILACESSRPMGRKCDLCSAADFLYSAVATPDGAYIVAGARMVSCACGTPVVDG